MRGIRTPVDVVEGGRVALQDAYTLPTLHVPQPQRAIVTATEQAAAVGGESQTVHHGAMSLQRHPSAALFDIPEPDRAREVATGQRASIRAPGHAMHPLCMSL